MIFEDAGHPMDIRSDAAMRDPALVDLQPYKDAVHNDRIQREAEQADRRKERMRKRYEGQGQITRAIPHKRDQDILMVTGNRQLKDPAKIRHELEELINRRKPDIAISGMATGADQIFAEICIEKGIPVHAYIPFLGQETRWPTRVQKRYADILRRCEKKIIVCDHSSKEAFHIRNAAMVAASTRAIAVHDGGIGGTSSTINRIKRASMPYVVIDNVTGA